MYLTVYGRRFRLDPLTVPAVERTPSMCLSLQEILVVGNCTDQVSCERPGTSYCQTGRPPGLEPC